MVFVTGPYNTSGNYISSGSLATTLKATGTLITGAKTMPAVANGRFYLFGNPYSSPVNMKLVTKSGFANFMYTWDVTLGSLGGYRTINNSTGTISQNTIQSGQAFWMYANNATNSLVFNESAKLNAGESGLTVPFRKAEDVAFSQISIDLLKYETSGLNIYDNTTCDFIEGANSGLDGNDATKPTQFSENLSIYRAGRDLSWETRPAIRSNDTLPLRMWGMKEANYQLKVNLTNFRAIEGTALVLLKDRYLNKETIINLTGNTLVDFAVTADTASADQRRFQVVVLYRSNAPTPVTNLNGTKGISIYPNPVAQGGKMQLQFLNKAAGKYTVTLYSIAGVQVQQGVVRHSGGTAVQAVDLKRYVSTGNYLLEVMNEKGDKEQVKMVIE
jgi:hypothetical protein